MPASVLFAPAVPLATVAVVAMSATPNMDHGVSLGGPMLVYPKRHADPRHVIVTALFADVQFRTTQASSPLHQVARRPVYCRHPPIPASHTGQKCQTPDWQKSLKGHAKLTFPMGPRSRGSTESRFRMVPPSAVTEARQDCVSARKSDVSRRNATQSQVASAGVTPLRGSPPGTSQRVKPSTLLRISSSTYSTKTLGRARIPEHDRHALGVARPGDRGSDDVPG